MDEVDTLGKFENFRWAVIRLATYRTEQAEGLLFGWVQVLDIGRPPPTLSEFHSANVSDRRGTTLIFRKATTRVDAAVAWYRSEWSDLKVPTLDGEPPLWPRDTPIRALDLADDPAWPDLGVPIGSDVLFGHGGPGDPAPFVGSTARGARLHRRLGDAGESSEILQSDEVRKYLGRRLHINLRDYPEYLGGLALTVPNPKIKFIRHYFLPTEDRFQERTVYRLTPQPGKTLAGLKLTILGRSSNILSTVEPVDVPEDGIVVHKSAQAQATGYVVSSEADGVLAYQTPLPFIRSIQVSVGRTISRRPAQVSRSDAGANGGSVDVESQTSAKDSGRDTTSVTAAGRIYSAEARRERKAQASRYEQTWFDAGQDREAQFFVNSRIGRARESVMIADAKFGARDTRKLAERLQRLDVPLKILTSIMAFRTSSPSDEGAHPFLEWRPTEIRRLRSLSAALQEFKKNRHSNISVKVLASPLALNDRFLAVDGIAWLLGDSLADLGKQGSLTIQVPDGEAILEKLNEMFYRAAPLEGYLESSHRSGEQFE